MFAEVTSPSSWRTTDGILLMLLIWASSHFVSAFFRAYKLRMIPSAQPAYLAYITAFKYIFKASQLVMESYQKFSIFKVPELSRWIVIMRGDSKYADEMRAAPNDTLSMGMAVHELLQTDYTLGPAIISNPYHIPICARLTKKLDSLFPQVYDEITTAFSDSFSSVPTEWTPIAAFDAITNTIARASNRIFVGLPLCRNPDYLKVNIGFTVVVPKAAGIIAIFPEYMKPLVARFLTDIPSSRARCLQHIRPLVNNLQDSVNNSETHEFDIFLAWLMEKAKGVEKEPEALACRILTMNFAALHTTTSTFVYALYRLAAHPEYARVLRSEVDAAVDDYGWTTKAIDSMHKVDSFIKESQRLEGLGTMSVIRKAIKAFTFSDGKQIPPGTLLSVASQATHLDENHYPDPMRFNPWRFSAMPVVNSRSQLVNVNSTFLPFGSGKHTCPGRWFASCEMKTLLAHIVQNYDVAFPQTSQAPKGFEFMSYCVPDLSAKVMFRLRRQT